MLLSFHWACKKDSGSDFLERTPLAMAAISLLAERGGENHPRVRIPSLSANIYRNEPWMARVCGGIR